MEQRGSWYTAYAAPYNGPRVIFCGACSTCFIFVGVFLTFSGAIMTGFAYRTPSPPFDTPFFTRNDKNNPLRIVGPVFLAIGLTSIIVSTISCCIISSRVSSGRRQEGRVLQDSNQIRNEDIVQPSNVYAHQPQAQYASAPYFRNEDTAHPSPYPQAQYTSTLPYPNTAAPHYPYPRDVIDQPPPYDSQFGVPPHNPYGVQVNSPYGTSGTAYVVPIATAPAISGAHPYPVPETK